MISHKHSTIKLLNLKYAAFPQRIRITQYHSIFNLKVKKGDHYIYDSRKWTGIICILSGKNEFQFEDCCFQCESEDVILIPRGSSYKVTYQEDGVVIIFNFFTDYDSSFSPIKVSGMNLYASYKKIQEYSYIPSEYSYYAIMSELYRMISKILMSDSQNSILLNNAVKIINDNFHDSSFLCRDISKKLNISESYLRARFKKEFGISPNRYLTTIRMQEALSLLTGNASITETALMVGYSDIFQFSKAFKKFYGYPPSEAKHMI